MRRGFWTEGGKGKGKRGGKVRRVRHQGENTSMVKEDSN